MADKLIRYTGDAPREEPDSTGRRSKWWPGEVRSVSESIAASLISVRQGWRFESPIGAPGALSKAKADAVDALVSDAGITSATVDGSGRPTSVTKGGTSYAITYPSATSVQITDGASFLRQITLDANGRFSSMV